MRNSTNVTNNDGSKLLEIIVRVEKHIDNFQKESHLIRQGLENMEKIHDDIIADFRNLGEAYWKLVSESNIKIDNGNDEVVCKSPVKEDEKKKADDKTSDIQNKQLNDYDSVPEKKKRFEHAHKGRVVRKKSERKKLTGWDCQKCEKWYENLDLSPDELQKRKNSCSRHRSKYNLRYETPPGFWNIGFSQPLSSSSDENCQQYEKWHKNLDLSPDELQKRKNSCSRHQSEHNSRYEAPPGFWNPGFSQPSSSSSDENWM